MTIKEEILAYLSLNGPLWGGQIERHVYELTGSKGGTVSRRLRELVEENKLDVCYVQVHGKGPKCSRYRIRNTEPYEYSAFPGLERLCQDIK